MPNAEGGPAAVARAILGGALRVRRGEHVAVLTWNHTLPWATACVIEARRVGARPFLVLEDEAAFWQSLDLGPSPRPWAGLAPPMRAAVARAEVLVSFPGPADRPRLRALPPEKLRPFLGPEDDGIVHSRRAGNRGVRCLLGYVSDAQAERWSVPAAMWRSQLIRGIVDVDYGAMARDAQRAARLLRHGRSLRLMAANGTDLSLRLRGRTPWVDDGRIDRDDRRHGRNVSASPAGSVVVAVDEGSAQGTVVGNRPSFLASGRVAGAQWEVERGRLRNYWYTEGAESFESEFAHAPRGREVVGLFALGLNPALAPGVPQAEDAEAGTVTLAIGGNSLYAGRNRCRYLSWITVGEATVTVDGHPLADRGKLL
jgi:leucyl aminopeptidase (aminopeptidase T)